MSRSPKQRRGLWEREAANAYIDGRGRNPICPHCNLPVTPGQDWDECHVGAPKFTGGKRVQVGHRRCNHLHNNRVDTPAFHKSNNVRERHIGARGPGLGRHPMPAGKRSRVRKTMRGTIVPRLSQVERHRAFMRERYGVEAQP